MFLLTKPADDQIQRFLAAQHDQIFSYAEIGMTQGREQAHYNIDHNRIRLGNGGAVFARAGGALRRWAMFDLGWVKLFDTSTPIETGATVCLRIHHFGFWSLNACR